MDNGQLTMKTMEASAKKSNPPADDSSVDPRIAELEARVKDLELQLAKLTDLAGRAQADLQNAKIRMEKDGQEMRKFASEVLLKRLLPVIDHFQRAFQQLPADLQANEWVKGITAIEQDLVKQVTDMGLQKMSALGQAIDPDPCEARRSGCGTGAVGAS